VAGTEKLLTFLTLAATLGTSFGLLGTVIGVSSSLKFIESDFSSTVAGLSVALYTTVGGLVVSIQAALFYAFFQSMSNALNNSICGWVRRLRQKPAVAGGGS
jgi:biopolymer transport protein ExbB/TolQ